MTLRRFLMDIKIGSFKHQCVAFAGTDSNPMSEFERGKYWEFESNYFVGENIEFIDEPEHNLMDYQVQEINCDFIGQDSMLVILLENEK